MPKFSIIVPSYSNTSGLDKCLESVVKFTDLSQTEILVICNGASEETRAICHKYPVSFIWSDEPLGFTGAANAGIESAMESGAEFIVLLNDDVILLDQGKNVWMDELYKPFVDPKMGITGPLKNYCPAAQREFLLFFCVMIRRTMLDEIGVLDMCFNPGGGEDTDLTARAVDRGWKIQAVPDEPPTHVNKGDSTLPAHQQGMWVTRFPLWHEAGCTVGSPAMFDEYQKVIARNAEILRKRYGVNIERAKTIEGWMADSELEWLGQQARKASVFIELGSWQGRSTRAIADNLPTGAVLYACDSWNGSSGEPDAHATAKQREGDGAFMKFFENLYDHIMLGRVIPVRMESGNAAESLAKKGIKANVLFVDGDHSEAGFRRDVNLWQPLLKDDGLFCGHDYYLPEQNPLAWVGVRTVVDELFPHAQQAPNTSIWFVKNGPPPTPWEMIKDLPVSESYEGYGGFFSA